MAFVKAPTGGCAEADSEERAREQVGVPRWKPGVGSSSPQVGWWQCHGGDGLFLDVFRGNMGIMKAIIL